MYNPNYTERAIPLVAVNDKTGKYQMTQEAIKFMRSVPAPLGVVSVAGLYRTGKSYLLNRMLINTNKPKQGFGVGPTINPCTKGLWCWGTPIKGKSQNGESINIIVIDTEGIGALDEDQTHDTRIFTLAILASSCFIYNSVGSIDETAVQNLSLVVNLTKHIQLKSTNKTYDDQENADQMAHYFPTFYWVVRDFSLKIQDQQGNEMSQKEYLEKALAPVKSSSQYDEEAEEKNKIRKLLTSFFRDRDCFTMVRPLVDEAKLQDLDSIPFEDLRPEFIEQVINFRKRVTQGLKIKTLNGKQLNGDMYCSMMSSYVMAINEGAVPNIENAWNYMCQEQCQKIQDDCEALFDKQLRDHMKFPVQEDYFNNTCENAFDICMMNYRQKAIGQMAVSLKFELELKERIKQKIRFAREQNLKASKQFLQKKVNEVFNPIIEQLKKQQFKTFDEFEKTISAAYDNLTTNGPNLPLTKQKFLELYKKVQKQGADYIFKCLNKQITNLKAMFKEKEDYYIKQLESIKNEQESDRRTYSMKISDLDKEKFQTQSKIERLQIELNRLIKEKQLQTEKLSMNLTYKQSEFESLRKDLEAKMKQTQEKYEEMSKTLTKEQKVWEMEKAISDNKIKQQTTTIQQLEKERHTLISKYEELNNQTSMVQKDVMNKNERKIGEMENQIKKLKENRNELSDQINSAKNELDEKTDKFERAERKLKEELNSKKREVESLKSELEMQKKKLEQELEDQRQRISKAKSTLNEDFKKQKDTITQLTEQLRRARADSQTRQAELEQKIKFLNDEKNILREQNEESKRLYTRQIQDLKMQSNTELQETQKIRIEQTKTEFITQIKNINIEYESKVKNYVQENEMVRGNLRDLETTYKVTKEKLEQIQKDYRQFQFQANEKIQILQSNIKNSERSMAHTYMEKEKLLKKKIFDLEQQIEIIKDKNESDQRQAEERHKECMIQLRVAYENQRQDIQKNHLRDKERAQRKFDQMVEDYESKHRQQIENLEEEMAFFKEQAAITEQSLRSQNQDYRYTIDARNKEIENLRNQLADLKALLNKKQDEYSRKFEQLTQTYKFEKQQMGIKYDNAAHSLSELEKSHMNLNHQKNRLANDLEKTKNILKENLDQYTTKKQQYTNSINNFKKRLSEKQNQLMELKINYEKQTALLTQENQHIRDKNSQLQSQLNRINDVYQEKIRKIKTQNDQTLQSTTVKHLTQRNQLQDKYEKTKKVFKQTQSALNKKLNQMEKERAVDVQKISNLEMKLTESEERKKFEVTSLTLQLDKLRELYKNDKTEMSNQIVKLRAESEELAKRKLEIETRFEKEALLSRNQLQNEINKRKNLEAKHSQIRLQLQTEIENLKQSKASDSSKYEATHQQARMRIEQNYRTKITETTKIIQIRTRQLEEITKKYDNETKELKEKLAIQMQNRNSLQIKLDRKTAEWTEYEKRLSEEINLLKAERQLRGLEFQKELEKQKLQLKIKVNDLENKVKSTDKQKMGYLMEVQRQKAKYSQLQSHYTQELQTLKDKVTKLEKDKVRLDKQNERLKIEKRTAKNASYITSRTGLEERKSTITIKKIEKKETSEHRYEDEDNKENIISQQMLID